MTQKEQNMAAQAKQLKKGDMLRPYRDNESPAEVVGFSGAGRAQVRVKSLWTLQERKLDHDITKLKRRYRLPDRFYAKPKAKRLSSFAY